MNNEDSAGSRRARLTLGIAIIVIAPLLSQHPVNPAERTSAGTGKADAQPRDATNKAQANPDNAPPTKTQHESDTERALRHNDEESVKINRKLAEYTGWLIVATLAGPGVILLAMLYQAYTARDTERRQLRAYIGIKSGSIEILGGNRPTGTLVMANAGQTPGNNVVVWTRAQVFPFPIPGILAGPSADVRRQLGASVALPGSVHPVTFMADHVLTEDERGAIQAGDATVCVWGEVGYRDMFGHERRTTFRLFVDPQGPRRMGMRIPLAFLPQGNLLT